MKTLIIASVVALGLTTAVVMAQQPGSPRSRSMHGMMGMMKGMNEQKSDSGSSESMHGMHNMMGMMMKMMEQCNAMMGGTMRQRVDRGSEGEQTK